MRRVVLIVGVVMAVALTSLPLVAVPARAACPPPGGASVPRAEAGDDDVTILGQGWGHGTGMSQYGAQGAARLGCTHAEILSTYFPGTGLGSIEDTSIAVGLFPNSPSSGGAQRLTVGAATDRVPWRYTSDGEPVALPRQLEGSTWEVSVGADGAYRVVDVTDGERELVWSGGDLRGRVEATLGSDAHRVYLPAKDRTYGRGTLRLQATQGVELAPMQVTVRLGSMEQYLLGLQEVPTSWPEQALQAQAVTGRSYALARRAAGLRDNCACHVWDSTSDQVYAGLGPEQRGWPDAVAATAGRVMTYDGDVAVGYYSSTHGGQSEAIEFSAFFGPTPVGYLQPVDDSAWELASDSDRNGVLRWSEGFTFTEVGEAFGVGVATDVTTPDPRGAGRRVGVPDRGYGGVVIEGTEGTVTVTGLEFVQRMGVRRRSERFSVVVGGQEPEPRVACTPVEDQADNQIVARSGGSGRLDTAAQVSADHWEASDRVILATGGAFPDALSAAALSARLDAPILLTGDAELAPQAREEIARLGATTAFVMGGGSAVSATVTEALAQQGVGVRRVQGASRYETAAAAAIAAGASPSGDVALAFGGDWPDAVSAGALAASTDRVPTLLTDSHRVPPATLEALDQLDPRRVILIGGRATIAGSVRDQLSDAGYEVARLSGANRWETSVAVARNGLSRGTPANRPAVLASGEDFPDALAAGGLAAHRDGGLLLVPQCDLDVAPGTESYLENAGFRHGTIVGGPAAVSDRVREQATGAFGG